MILRPVCEIFIDSPVWVDIINSTVALTGHAGDKEDTMRTLWDDMSFLVFPAEDTDCVRAGIIAIEVIPCVP